MKTKKVQVLKQSLFWQYYYFKEQEISNIRRRDRIFGKSYLIIIVKYVKPREIPTTDSPREDITSWVLLES